MGDNYGWPESYGFSIGGDSPVVVVSVNDNSLAQKAGLQPGDQILEIDQQNVRSFTCQEVIAAAKRCKNNPPSMVVISRIRTVDLRPKNGIGYGLSFKGSGPVYVCHVVGDSPAARAGICVGDMLLQVNGFRVKHARLQDVETILHGSGQMNLKLVLIAGPITMRQAEPSSRVEVLLKRYVLEFCKHMNYYLIGKESKKTHLIALIKRFSKDRNIASFSRDVSSLLNNPCQRKLIPHIKKLVPASQQRVFDQIVTSSSSASKNKLSKVATPDGSWQLYDGPERPRTVRIRRQHGTGSFGMAVGGGQRIVVSSVDRGGPAYLAGLKPGDIILQLNGVDLSGASQAEVVDLLQRSGSYPSLLVQRVHVPVERRHSHGRSSVKFRKTFNSSPSINFDVSHKLSPLSGHEMPKESHVRDPALFRTGDSKALSKGFKYQMAKRLTKGEQLVVKQALDQFKGNRDIPTLVQALDPVLDDSSKLQILHYISSLLPANEGDQFDDYAVDIVSRNMNNSVVTSVFANSQDIYDTVCKIYAGKTLWKPGHEKLQPGGFQNGICDKTDIAHENLDVKRGSTLEALLSIDESALLRSTTGRGDSTCMFGTAAEDGENRAVSLEARGNPVRIATQADIHQQRFWTDQEKLGVSEATPFLRREGNVRKSPADHYVHNGLVSKRMHESREKNKNGSLASPMIAPLPVSAGSCESDSAHSSAVQDYAMNSNENPKQPSVSQRKKVRPTVAPKPPRSHTSSFASVSSSSTVSNIHTNYAKGVSTSTTESVFKPSCESQPVVGVLPPPPPPPPPIGTMGRTVGSPPPPPLPSVPSPPGPSSHMQLKRLNWERLADPKIENTVWREIGADSVADLIDYEELQELFTTKPSLARTPVQTNEKKRRSLLDAKKTHSLSILLAHLKIPLEEIKMAIWSMDDSKIPEAHLQTVLNCCPEESELRGLDVIMDDRTDNLSLADQLILTILRIPFYEERLQAMLFRTRFHDRLEEIKPGVAAIQAASQELKSSQMLKKILEIVLATGNYINQGYNGVAAAAGFRISFLSKLITTKTADNQSTLLHVIVNRILNNKPELLNVKSELLHVPDASKTSSQMLKQEIDDLQLGIKKIDSDLARIKGNSSPGSEDFCNVMQQFVADANESFHDLLHKYSQMQLDFQDLVNFFGEDCTKTTTEDFFGAFAIFLQHLENSKADLLSKRERQERQEKDRQILIKRLPWARQTSFANDTTLVEKTLVDSSGVKESERDTARVAAPRMEARTSGGRDHACDDCVDEIFYRPSEYDGPVNVSNQSSAEVVRMNSSNIPDPLKDAPGEKENNAVNLFAADASETQDVKGFSYSTRVLADTLPCVERLESVLATSDIAIQLPSQMNTGMTAGLGVSDDDFISQYARSEKPRSSGMFFVLQEESRERGWCNPQISTVATVVPKISKVLHAGGESKLLVGDQVEITINLAHGEVNASGVRPFGPSDVSPTPLLAENRQCAVANRADGDVSFSMIGQPSLGYLQGERPLDASTSGGPCVGQNVLMSESLTRESPRLLKSGFGSPRKQASPVPHGVSSPFTPAVVGRDTIDNMYATRSIEMIDPDVDAKMRRDVISSMNSLESSDKMRLSPCPVLDADSHGKGPIQGGLVEEQAYARRAAILSTRSPNSSPKLINLVKEKLRNEQERLVKPKLKRKITEHEQPLYALVMKETLAEYEQLQTDRLNQEVMPSLLCQGVVNDEYRQSPDFLQIMQEKLKERAPELHESSPDLAERKSSVAEELYVGVIGDTLREYNHEKANYERKRKLGLSNVPRPNFISMLEVHLKRSRLIGSENEKSEASLGLTEDEPMFALIIKAALLDFRQNEFSSANYTLGRRRDSLIGDVVDACNPSETRNLAQQVPVATSDMPGQLLGRPAECGERWACKARGFEEARSRSSSGSSTGSEEVSMITQGKYVQHRLSRQSDFTTASGKPPSVVPETIEEFLVTDLPVADYCFVDKLMSSSELDVAGTGECFLNGEGEATHVRRLHTGSLPPYRSAGANYKPTKFRSPASEAMAANVSFVDLVDVLDEECNGSSVVPSLPDSVKQVDLPERSFVDSPEGRVMIPTPDYSPESSPVPARSPRLLRDQVICSLVGNPVDGKMTCEYGGDRKSVTDDTLDEVVYASVAEMPCEMRSTMRSPAVPPRSLKPKVRQRFDYDESHVPPPPPDSYFDNVRRQLGSEVQNYVDKFDDVGFDHSANLDEEPVVLDRFRGVLVPAHVTGMNSQK